MADLFAVAGAHFSIGTVAMSVPTDDVDASDFASVTWVEVADWQTMGAIGDQAAEIATDLISRGRTAVQKGTKRSPAMTNQFAVNSDDAGQIAMYAASNSRLNYPFKIEFDDAPSAGTPTLKYFLGLVMSAQEQGGGANTVRMLSANVAPNTNIVTVPAAA